MNALNPTKMFIFKDLKDAKVIPVGIMLNSSACTFLIYLQT